MDKMLLGVHVLLRSHRTQKDGKLCERDAGVVKSRGHSKGELTGGRGDAFGCF